ncbi:unnamed protein product [Symbiodinium necroappetens]|uniref:Uncharacterized protein n=1 Tax=Symbiodinium necroappetens TaxID=1628268 RepID=A0A812YT21_9DINO|nr:unnamed protein product [Symbiodinium necroappetens]
MDHYGLQAFKDAVVSYSETGGQLNAQLLEKLLLFVFATGFAAGCVFLGVGQYLRARYLTKSDDWPEIFLTSRGVCYHVKRDCASIRHTTPSVRRICSFCSREPSRLQVSTKKDG